MKKKWFLVTLCLALLFWGGYRLNYPYPQDPFRVHLYTLDTVKQTLQQLENDRIIFSARLASWFLTLSGFDTQLHQGVYELNNRMSFYQILQMWKSGKQKTVEVTIKEGDDLFDIGKTLLKVGLLTNEKNWIAWIQSPKELDRAKEVLGLSPHTKLHTLEGLLYPDTYYLFAGDSPVKFIDIALNEFRDRYQFLYSKLGDEEKLAVFKMASLVEKETSVPEERPLVASVIHNRLNIQMKLRFDPTVIYTLKVIGKYYDNFKDGFVNIKREHYSIASPYNTYYIKGLPRTPISSFSLESLKAVMDPPQTEYLFFVAKKRGRPQEGHHFTTNYEDHLSYVKMMLNR